MDVGKYRKKPVVIEAVKWNPLSPGEMIKFCPNYIRSGVEECMYIETLEGAMKADPGDYIIKGIQGEFYPCKPDIFEATYDEVE